MDEYGLTPKSYYLSPDTREFLDDVLEYFQEDLSRAEEFEEWKEGKDG
jgi:hypothetical protein